MILRNFPFPPYDLKRFNSNRIKDVVKECVIILFIFSSFASSKFKLCEDIFQNICIWKIKIMNLHMEQHNQMAQLIISQN